MRVTQIQDFDKKRSKVFIDGEFAFVLYKGELCDYGITENAELSVENMQNIMKELLPKRGIKRCMNLLQKKDYTRQQLIRKLKEGGYPEKIIMEALAYVESYGYVDDLRYAMQYIRCYTNSRSRKRIESDLLLKGVQKDVIEKAFQQVIEQGDLADESALIETALRKKGYDAHEADVKAKRKMYLYLANKGFCTELIRRALDIT